MERREPKSGIEMTGVSKTSLLIFVDFRFLALTAKIWKVNDHRGIQELTMNQSKATPCGSGNPKGLVFLSPDQKGRFFGFLRGKATPCDRVGQLQNRKTPKSPR